MPNALFADISGFQNPTIGPSYWPWSSAGDGVSRLICKASEGVGFQDKNFAGYWQQAIAAGAGMIFPYHYARPDLNPGTAGAANEARWFAQVLQGRLGAQDRAMLDLEQNESLAWAHAFHDALVANRPLKNKPVLYDSVSHFLQFFAADLSLAAKYDCALAAYPPQMQAPPAAPPGWNLLWWQFTDNDTQQPRIIMDVPGIGLCDVNLWLGGLTKGQRGEMLLQHPTDAGRLDLVYLAPDGNVWHARNNSDGLAGLVASGNAASMTLGAPAEKLLSVEAAWSNNGVSLNIVAVGVSGQVYGKAMDFGGVLEMDWTPIPGVLTSVPVATPPDPKLETDIQALGTWLKAAPSL